MTNKHFLTETVILFAFVLTACQIAIAPRSEETLSVPQTVEVTRLVPQTIEDTRIVQQPIIKLETENTTASPESTVTSLSITVQTGSSSVQMDPAYFDGFIVLIQYYTLLDHGLYKESYQLLSSTQQKRYSFEDYTSFYTHDLKALGINSIQPYNYWRVKQGLPSMQILPDELRYVIFMTAFHNGAAWNEGGTAIPDNITGFQSLVLENNEWKIDEFNTSPWAH